MYSHSPYGTPEPLHQAYTGSPAPPTAAPINPGSLTYTTSAAQDGSILYHSFRAVSASYQTPSGVVSGIQWVPGESSRHPPPGAVPASSNFAESWQRGQSSKDEQKSIKEWQRSEDKRRKKEEKESAKIVQQRALSRGDPESELRIARERDAVVNRERRKSVSQNSSPYIPPAAPPYANAYPNAQQPFNPTPYGSQPAAGTMYGTSSPGSTYGRDNKYTPGGTVLSDLGHQFSHLETGSDHGGGGGASSGRPRKYSTATGDPAAAERMRRISGNLGAAPYGSAAKPYSAASALAGATYSPEAAFVPPGPYTASGAAQSFPHSHSPQPTYPTQSTYPGQRSASPIPPPSHHQSYPGQRSTSPMPHNAHQSTYPGQRSASPIPPSLSQKRAASPMPGAYHANPGVYPPGHILEGQAVPPGQIVMPMISRATTPVHGHMPPGAAFSQPPVQFPHAGNDHARALVESGQQLAAPEGFSRPINAAQPFTPFEPTKVQTMDDFVHTRPKMPPMLKTHDVYPEDWSRLMDDITLAWTGRLPVPNITPGRDHPKKSTLTADLVDLWNMSFFARRGVELVLYKGRERRSGPSAGIMDMPEYLLQGDTSSSSSSSSETDSDDDGEYGGVYGRPTSFAPGQGSMADVMQARQRRREMREEAKRKKREKKSRRKAKARNKKYSLYLTCVRPQPQVGAGTPGMQQPIPMPSVGGMPQAYGVPGVHGSHTSGYGY